MALLFGEIVVEVVAMAATLAGIVCLVYLLAVVALERREIRLLAEASAHAWTAQRGQDHEPSRSRAEAPQRSLTSTVQIQG